MNDQSYLHIVLIYLVEMGNNSYQRHLNQEQADIIEAFILFDGGDRKQLCDEIWNEAITSIRSGWRNGTYEALEELRTGNCMARVIAIGLAYKASSGSVKIQIRSIPFLFPFRLRFRLNSSKIPSKLV